ncbi:hypothetical protein ACVBEQ_00890 [Nakamurella sp. GG22]
MPTARPPMSIGADILAAAIGAGAVVVGATQRLTRSAGRVVGPLADLLSPIGRSLLSPPGIPAAATPELALRRLVSQGTDILQRTERALNTALGEVVPVVTDAVLDRVGITDLVLERVDLLRIVEAVLDQLDLTEVVLQRVDLDRVIAAADLDAAAGRLDVDAVAARLDVDAAAARLDLDALASRFDVDAVAARLDVDAVAARVDVDAVAARLDVGALAARFGPAAFANLVLEAVDLPDNVISSTGAAVGEAVRWAGKQGTGAYVQVVRVAERVPLRRRESETEVDG